MRAGRIWASLIWEGFELLRPLVLRPLMLRSPVLHPRVRLALVWVCHDH